MALLELSDVNVFYGNSHVLFDLSLEVEQNEVAVLLGRNEAGKTTTLRGIVGTVPRREGRITYREDDIVDAPVNRISRSGIKLVPEDRRIFPTLTVQENLQVAAETAADPRPVEEMYDIFPTLDDLRESRGRDLSGGEQQMLSVGRALVQRPDLLLLDEPTEGLAPVIVEDLRRVFEEIVQEDVTALLTEQNVQFALDLAQRAYIIETGSKSGTGASRTSASARTCWRSISRSPSPSRTDRLRRNPSRRTETGRVGLDAGVSSRSTTRVVEGTRGTGGNLHYICVRFYQYEF